MSGIEDHFTVGEYRDDLHAETTADLEIGEYGYKYRMLDGVMMPPYITPSRYALSRRLDMRSSDVCYTSYPKSGSTWLAYILVLILNRGEVPSGRTLRDCLHWVASSWSYPRSEEDLRALPGPRIFKSHMPVQMALGGEPVTSPAKYVYIARNPKDVAVSYYHFERDKSWSGGYSGPWEHWLRLFSAGRVQRGDWFDHVLGWWRLRDAANVRFLRYEDLQRNFDGEVRALADFLGLPLSPAVLRRIRGQTTFQAMSTSDFSRMAEFKEFGGFFRKGRVGSWTDQFTPAESAAFDALIERRLAGTGLRFDYA